MNLLDTEGQTYSFGGAETEQTLKELSRLFMDMGVDIRDKSQLQNGFQQLFHIQYLNMPNLDERSYIFAPNHVSDFDALIVGLVHDHIKIMSKMAWVQNERLAAFLSTNYSLVGIDRESKVSQARALVDMIKHLSVPGEARHALIFPQGTISDINKNNVERVQEGVFALATKANAPILPIYIEQPNFHYPTRILFGKPMDIPERKQDCRALWLNEVIALQNSLQPQARTPVLTEKHANNNKPGDPFF